MDILKRNILNYKNYILGLCMSGLFLTACEFEGLMPQYFDDILMDQSNEAVAHYHETGEVLNFDSERRYLFINSTDVLNVPDSEDKDPVEIDPGVYEVPADIEAGEYNIKLPMATGTLAAAVLVYDSEDNLVLELPLEESHMDGGRILLNDGYRLELRSIEAKAELRQDAPREDAGFLELNSVKRGMTVVGLHIPSGEYALMSKEIAIKRADGSSQIFLNDESSMYSGTHASRDDIVFESDLRDGGTIELNSSVPVKLTLYDGDIIFNEHVVRLQKLD